MKIRKATEKDIPRVIEIFKIEYSKEPYNEKWSNELAASKIEYYLKDNELFILEVNDKVIGFIIINTLPWDNGPIGYIREVAIDAGYQGKGFGKELINFAEDYFRKKGIKEVSLMSSNKSKAFKIYKHFGYKEEGFVSMIKKLK